MYHFIARVLFVSGFLLGVALALLASFFHNLESRRAAPPSEDSTASDQTTSLARLYERWFNRTQLKRTVLTFDSLRYNPVVSLLSTESAYLYARVRVLCVVLAKKLAYVRAAKGTWTKQCNKVVYAWGQVESARKIPIRRSKKDASWPVLCRTLLNLPDAYDWILVVRDVTFAVVENVRYLVAGLDPIESHYLGHAITFWGTTYNVGEAGYVLSTGTLQKFKHGRINESNACDSDPTFWNLEDYYLGKSLANLNVHPRDTRDKQGLSTFHGFNLMKLLFPGSTTLSNYYKFSIYPTRCCSSNSVTFQIEDADKMYTYNYLLHQLQVFKHGGRFGNKVPSTPRPEREVWQSFLMEQGINDTEISAQRYYRLWKDLIGDNTPLFKTVNR